MAFVRCKGTLTLKSRTVCQVFCSQKILLHIPVIPDIPTPTFVSWMHSMYLAYSCHQKGGIRLCNSKITA